VTQLASVALALATGPVLAGEGGFSYVMGLGGQSFRYEEKAASLPVNSVGRSSGPLLVTGALYELPGGHLFSLDNETTFYPGRGSETWRSRSDLFNGATLSNRELQRNAFSLRQSHTQLGGHWRVTPTVFASGGVALRALSFKRYSFFIGPDAAVSTPAGTTVEESVSEVLGTVGVALESGPLRGQAVHYGVRVALGVPLWQRVENTSQPQGELPRHQRLGPGRGRPLQPGGVAPGASGRLGQVGDQPAGRADTRRHAGTASQPTAQPGCRAGTAVEALGPGADFMSVLQRPWLG